MDSIWGFELCDPGSNPGAFIQFKNNQMRDADGD